MPHYYSTKDDRSTPPAAKQVKPETAILTNRPLNIQLQKRTVPYLWVSLGLGADRPALISLAIEIQPHEGGREPPLFEEIFE